MTTSVVPFEVSDVYVRTPGKINIALCVGARRPDGYHELATIFQAVSLYDIVSARSSATEISCEVLGSDAHRIGPGTQNLAYRAAQLLKTEYQVTEGVHLTIEKRIPVAGGMAGGSADAAGALLACAHLWELPVSTEDLMRLGARLGADVPFPLMGGCAVGLGRGDMLTATLARGVYHWVLAVAPIELSTTEAFARFDHLRETTSSPPPLTPIIPRPLMLALACGDIGRVGSLLVNDLAPAALSMAPQLRGTLAAGRGSGSVGAVISGSGPTIAFLSPSESAARELADALASDAVKEVLLVTGPVSGAAIL